MQQISTQSLQTKLQLIQSTCLFNKKLNHNNTIDGTNIIYLAGACIVFHNIFQNQKKIINRISDSDVIGIAFNKSNSNTIALAVKNQKINQQENQHNYTNNINNNNNNINCVQVIQNIKINKKIKIQVYELGQKTHIMAELNQNIEFIDMEFMDRKRIVMLGKQKNQYYFYILEEGQKTKRKQVQLANPQRFITRDRRIYLLGHFGMRIFQIQFQTLYKQLKFSTLKIDDYVVIDNQYQIILSNNKLYCYHQLTLIDQYDLQGQFLQTIDMNNSTMSMLNSTNNNNTNNNNFNINNNNNNNNNSNIYNTNLQLQAKCLQKVGRNILVGYKNNIMLSHVILQKNKFKFLNNYQYKQKIKGGILSMEISFDQMHLAMAVELIQRDTVKIQNFMFNLSILSSQKKFINPFIRLTTLGTENGQISSFSGVIPFDTYYLVGSTIVNYNYNQQVQKKHKFSLHQAPKQIVIHPLGYQIVCIFQTQIKFYLKIQNQLVQIWTQQLICTYAKYTSYGMLLLSCLQDNFYQLMLYDTNSFKKVRNIQNVMIKYPINKIQLAQQDTQVILYVNNGLFIFKLKTGQKMGEFKGKKQNIQIVKMSYNSPLKTLLVYTKKKILLIYKVYEQIGYDFKLNKTINIKQQITYIQLNDTLQTVFIGTKTGKIIWTRYPFILTENNDKKYLEQTQSIYLSQDEINQIYITKNLKYLFVSFKNQGMNILRIRKAIKYNQNNRFTQFDISNLNFLQTSSKNALETGYEKLKVLLEKRKTVFNDLQQYKKQWQIKKTKKLRQMDNNNKYKQLAHINQSLRQVQKLKKQKVKCYQQLKNIQQQTQMFTKQKQQKYHKEIILYYDQNVQLKSKKQRVLRKCQQQFKQIQLKCKQNLNDISKQLKCKYEQFISNYEQMKTNLVLYQKRLQIQKQQAQQILLEILKNKIQKLSNQQINQNKKSNQLKAMITRLKKQSQRFLTRRFLLQSKKSFFYQQFSFNKNQRVQLMSIKQQLQEQLRQLQLVTNKKQKRLKKYFKQNEILMKYQMVHNNLINNLENQVKFVNQQKDYTSKNIVTIQKQLSEVAELNQVYEEKILDHKKQIQKMKNKKKNTAQKVRYLTYVIEQMSTAIDKIKINLNQQNKANLFGSIYKNFYIEKKLQKIILTSQSSNPSKQQSHTQNKIFDSADNKRKIVQNMKQQKQYLQKNMMLFEKHYNKTNEQMNLNYLRYQTQNYNLIAECNIRKEQTHQKKRVLHQLIDEVKETQLYMNQMQKDNFDQQKYQNAKSMSIKKSTDSIPFIAYKKSKEEQGKVRLLRKQQSDIILFNNRAKKSAYQVRKMLEVQRLTRPNSQTKLQRKIKTAMLKNRNNIQPTVHVQSAQFLQPAPQRPQSVNIWKKPLTATGKRHNAPFGQYYNYSRSHNKSNSKPTTCTTYTKNKMSIYN